jgi:hypothetical protein
MFCRTRLIIPALSAILLTSAAYGVPLSGTVIGEWSNPVLTGNLIRATGQAEFFDNTATAQYNVVNSPDGTFGSTLVYGANSVGGQPFSVLTFFGATLSGVPGNTPVKLGTLTFLNGTSSLDSLIFGATLTLSIKDDITVDPLIATAGIVTTENTGFDPNFDADIFYFNVLFPTTFNVYEGNNATIDIYGQFIGDPQIELTSIQLSAGETGGFIGNGIPEPTPEPATVLLTLAGLATLGIRLKSRKNARLFEGPGVHNL